MTNKEIKDKIELEFGWLSPDEKYKLYVLVISVYNSAIDSSAEIVKISVDVNGKRINNTDQYRFYNSNDDNIVLRVNKDHINTLKLKL